VLEAGGQRRNLRTQTSALLFPPSSALLNMEMQNTLGLYRTSTIGISAVGYSLLVNQRSQALLQLSKILALA
jgi:hypothetical protein